MISSVVNSNHQKHAKLAKPSLGQWGREELVLLGASCKLIAGFASALTDELRPDWKIAFADADHSGDDATQERANLTVFTKQSGGQRLDIPGEMTSSQRHAAFNNASLILLNGNHFSAARQIVFVTAEKSLEGKLDLLSDVALVLLKDAGAGVPEYLKPYVGTAPVFALSDIESVVSFFKNYLAAHAAALNGLVLAGGKSERMGTDKSLLAYHGRPQREHLYDMLLPVCQKVFVSCNTAQNANMEIPGIEDRFLGLGPMGGLLSAFQSAPDAAWLTVAGDMPDLTHTT